MLPSPTAAPTAARIKVNPDDQVFPDACAILLFPLNPVLAAALAYNKMPQMQALPHRSYGPGYILTTIMGKTNLEKQAMQQSWIFP